MWVIVVLGKQVLKRKGCCSARPAPSGRPRGAGSDNRQNGCCTKSMGCITLSLDIPQAIKSQCPPTLRKSLWAQRFPHCQAAWQGSNRKTRRGYVVGAGALQKCSSSRAARKSSMHGTPCHTIPTRLWPGAGGAPTDPTPTKRPESHCFAGKDPSSTHTSFVGRRRRADS